MKKKKHLQFNDITAPSLARRAARRGAEKGESGRMEPGVINVFFLLLLFPRKKQHWIVLVLFKPLSHSIIFLLFCSLAHSFFAFVEMKLSIIWFRKVAVSPLLQNLYLWGKTHLPWSWGLSPQPPPLPYSQSFYPPFVCLHQSAIDVWHNKEEQPSMLSPYSHLQRKLVMTWKENNLRGYISVAVSDPSILCNTPCCLTESFLIIEG